MGKIIRIKTPQDNLIDALEKLLSLAKEEKITSFVFAAGCESDRQVATSWFNADMGMRQYLISHLQTDLNYAVVEANVDRLIEWV